MLDSTSSILALDVGGQRIGVAVANIVARIANPLVTIENTADIIDVLQKLIVQERAIALVVGLPRGLSGQTTEQTNTIESFVDNLKPHVSIPIHMQDEAVTSRQAEEELKARGKPYNKGDIDALAATYILEDFLNEHPETRV
jgi:putative holliday junction resolvase